MYKASVDILCINYLNSLSHTTFLHEHEKHLEGCKPKNLTSVQAVSTETNFAVKGGECLLTWSFEQESSLAIGEHTFGLQT